ncbi:hypothetical protein DFO67_1049 [Modicisalibacter xianhensis]|uniref:Uncharacterized protein n=1 Tax=Modicisalibacter xianhensis TaxID=442341 RepID=A0A4R8FVC5_9GAMM|nr:hypothetical protein [Halomonas xianhensis]TDX30754.1 hypothetical protein DFO67_1049 [Halomonas xianhensis]
MTYYTGGAPKLDSRTLLDVPASTGETFGASFEGSFNDNPATSLYRIGELTAAEQGFEWTSPSTWIDGKEPARLPATEARQKVKGLGLDSIKIPDQGITEDALEILVRRHQEDLARDQVLQRAPQGSTLVQVAAGLAATFVDPLNIAAAFIPIVGEARYAALVSRQTSALGRAGVRAGMGAIEGAAGAALLEPLPLLAAYQDQSEYGLSDTLTNIAFGSVLGGGLHATGGAISDAVRRRAASANPGNPLPDAPNVGSLTPALAPDRMTTSTIGDQGITSLSLADLAARAPSPQAMARALDEDPFEAIRTTLARQIQNDEDLINRRATGQAAREIAEQMDTSGRIGNVADMRAQLDEVTTELNELDKGFRQRAKEFQGQGMRRKEAERAARDAIAQRRQQLTTQRDQIDNVLKVNRQAEMNTEARTLLQRGEIPARYRDQVEQRAAQIREGFKANPLGANLRTARERAQAAHWTVRRDALRAAVVQSVTGRRIDAEAIYDLQDPSRARAAFERLRSPVPRQPDNLAVSESQRAQETVTPQYDELEDARAALAEEERRFNEVVARMSEDQRTMIEQSSPELEEAVTLAQLAQRYGQAYRAAAYCNLT